MRYDNSYTVFFRRSVQTYGLVVKQVALLYWVGRCHWHEFDFKFCRVLKFSAAPRPFCMALSQSVDWHTSFYIAALSLFFFLNFISGDLEFWMLLRLAMTEFYLLTWISNLHCFAALGVGPRAKTQPHELAWNMSTDYSLCWPKEVFQTTVYFLICWKCWKKGGPHKRHFQCSSFTLTLLKGRKT